jgi:hypothetical protein
VISTCLMAQKDLVPNQCGASHVRLLSIWFGRALFTLILSPAGFKRKSSMSVIEIVNRLYFTPS